jgi:hypothetical protein
MLRGMVAALSQDAQTALIAAAAAVGAAVVTSLASTYAARVRIREVRLMYDQKLHENYLATARTYTASIYVPLSLALTRLSSAFVSFRDGLDPERRETPDEDSLKFTRAIDEFLLAIETLTSRGADAFLTTQLEDEVISLTTFLQKSLRATAPRAKVVFEYRFYGLGASVAREAAGRWARFADRVDTFTVITLGLSATFKVDKLLEAPLTSQEFEKRLVDDLPRIKSLIKEVTLGAHSGPA